MLIGVRCMASRRLSPLPRNWAALRRAVFKRDAHRCVKCGSCERLECDHVGDRDDHRIEQMQTLCHACHSVKTARDAGNSSAMIARARMRTQERSLFENL